jgi:F0F1-type ATP synthase assembly protein I
MLLAGVAVGLGVGYVIDRLAKTSPLFLVLGVFVGFAAALYAVYLETR